MKSYKDIINEASKKNDTWKQTSMTAEEAEKKYGKSRVCVKKEALRNGDDMIEVLVPLREDMSEDDFQYATVLKGGSIGEKNIRSASDLKGMTVDGNTSVKSAKADAKEEAKRRNKGLSPGEKKYYGLKYFVVQVKDGKYTGK
jgi:hypothetical protein